MPSNVYDLTRAELEKALAGMGERPFRAAQIWRGLYKNLYTSFAQFRNVPRSLLSSLEARFDLRPLEPARAIQSQDMQTRKALFRLRDGHLIETVLMRYDPDTFAGRDRRTLCVSTQAGCAMGCVFCATGQMGFRRNLTSGEIVAQVMHFAALLRAEAKAPTNIVFMGMGEPFHNYDNTMAAIDRLNDAEGFHFGARRITVSTVGLVPQIRRFADEHRQVNLAVSLHAWTDESRTPMLPVNKRYPIRDVLEACRYYVSQTRRRVTFEWALIEGVNDTAQAAHGLVALLQGMLCHVNCIPLNPTKAYAGRASRREQADEFKRILEAAGIPCTVRVRRGVEIAAGCGQLAVGGIGA